MGLDLITRVKTEMECHIVGFFFFQNLLVRSLNVSFCYEKDVYKINSFINPPQNHCLLGVLVEAGNITEM